MVQTKSLMVLVLIFLLTACAPPAQTQPTKNATVVEEVKVEEVPQARVETPTPKVEVKNNYPDEVYFWVNDFLIPHATLYNGSKFISIRESQIRTFAGSFGPYFEDPTEHINVTLCAELTKTIAAPACEKMDFIYRE